MKISSLIVAMIAGCCVLTAACQAAQPSDKNPAAAKTTVQSPAVEKAKVSQSVPLTGSHISSNTKTAGRISCGTDNVTVISRYEIEHSGASSVADLLRRVPGLRSR